MLNINNIDDVQQLEMLNIINIDDVQHLETLNIINIGDVQHLEMLNINNIDDVQPLKTLNIINIGDVQHFEISNYCCPVKIIIFFTTFRMTMIYLESGRVGVCWRLCRQQTPARKSKRLNVISNEVRDIRFF